MFINRPRAAANQPNQGILRNVQALRAFAAMLVMFEHFGKPGGIEAHYFLNEPALLSVFGHSGRFGVDLFFVISGFIMVATSWQSFGRQGASLEFLIRRCIRIYPPYWFVLIPLTAVFLFAPSHLTQFHEIHTNLLSSFLLLPQSGQQLLPVAWTLVYEMSFYLIFALLLTIQQRFIFSAMVIWFFLELLQWLLFHQSSNRYLNFLSEPFPIDFIFGTVVGLFYAKGMLRGSPVLYVLTLIAIIAIWPVGEMLGDMSPIIRVFVYGPPAALLVYTAITLETTARVSSPKVVVAIGNSSYALYIWHLPVLSVLAQGIASLHLRGIVWHFTAVFAMIVFMIAFAQGVYQFIERPMTRFLNARLTTSMSAARMLPKAD